MLSQVQNTYSAFFFISLKDWAERKKPEEQYEAIKASISKKMAGLPGAVGFAFPPPAIMGVGTSGGATFILQDRAGKDIEFLAANTQKFIDAAQKRPEFSRVTTTFTPSVPQLFVDVDRDRALKQGVNVADVYKVLQCFMGSGFINYFNKFGRQWQVFLQAEGDYRTNIDNIGQFYVRNSEGQAVPLSALTSTRSIVGPEFTMRYNLYRSAQINATAAPGVSSTQAMKALEEVFAQTMPPEMGFDYSGMSFQEQKAQKGISPAAIFAFSFLCVFLILAAQYESWSLPFSVLLGTPVAVAGAFAGLLFRSFENNIYAQIGLVMLIGLAAKNAILIVEFAKLEYEKGKPLVDATLEGARLRLRPILMTSFAFILGCVPLAIASGAGAISRQVMGIVVIGGMLAASFIAIFLIPVTYYVVTKLGHRKDTGGHPPSEERLPAMGRRRVMPRQRRETAMRKLFRFHIKALSLLARLRLLNVLSARLRRLYPRRLDIIFDLKSELFVVTLLALVTGGCMMGPDYRRPSVDMPQSFQYEAKEAAEAADTEWWKAFQDPVLDGLIAEALANNKNVKIAAANIEQAAGVLTQTRSPLFPQANYNGSAGRERVSLRWYAVPAGVANPHDFFQIFAGASWEIDLWGRVRRLSEAARAELLASEEARRGAILSLVASVAGTYMQLRGLDEQLDIAKRSLGTYDAVGQALRTAVPIRPGLPDDRRAGPHPVRDRGGDHSAARIADRAERKRPVDPSRAQPRTDRTGQDVQRDGFSRRSGRAAVTAPGAPAGPRPGRAEPDCGQCPHRRGQGTLLPDHISHRLLRLCERQPLRPLQQSSRVWSYAGSFTGPIFTAGAISGQVTQSEAAQKAALIGYQAAIQNAFADVENALMIREKLVGPDPGPGTAREGEPGIRAPGQNAVRRGVRSLSHGP